MANVSVPLSFVQNTLYSVSMTPCLRSGTIDGCSGQFAANCTQAIQWLNLSPVVSLTMVLHITRCTVFRSHSLVLPMWSRAPRHLLLPLCVKILLRQASSEHGKCVTGSGRERVSRRPKGGMTEDWTHLSCPSSSGEGKARSKSPILMIT